MVWLLILQRCTVSRQAKQAIQRDRLAGKPQSKAQHLETRNRQSPGVTGGKGRDCGEAVRQTGNIRTKAGGVVYTRYDYTKLTFAQSVETVDSEELANIRTQVSEIKARIMELTVLSKSVQQGQSVCASSPNTR